MKDNNEFKWERRKKGKLYKEDINKIIFMTTSKPIHSPGILRHMIMFGLISNYNEDRSEAKIDRIIEDVIPFTAPNKIMRTTLFILNVEDSILFRIKYF